MISIPDVPPTSAEMRQFLQQLKLAVEQVNTLVVAAADAAGLDGDGNPSEDITPPAAPADLSGLSAGGGVTLTWVNPGDEDLMVIEIWESDTNVQPDVAANPEKKVGTVPGIPNDIGTFNRSGVAAGQHLYYWVRAMDTSGNFSDFNATSGVDVYVTAGTGDGTAPSAPTGVTAAPAFQGIWLFWNNPADTDLEGVVIYENTTNNSGTAQIVGTEKATSSQKGSYFRGGLPNGVARYYWLKAVDKDGNLSAFSTGVTATTATIDPVDLGTVVGFGAPTGLSVNSVLSTDTDGSQVVYLNVGFSAIANATLSFYEVAVSEAGGGFIDYTTSSTSYRLRVKANTSYEVKVRGVDRNGNRTSYSSSVTVTSTKKTAAPNVPTGLSALVGIGSIYLQWTNPSDAELAQTVVYESTSAGFAGEVAVGTVSAAPGQVGKFARTGMGTNVQRWYRLKSIDTSGNLSAFSASINATTAKATSSDIIVDSVIANSIVANVTTTNVLNANVLQSASTIPASLVIGSTGFTLGAISDPATPINAGTTKINPGQILVSGSTTLANWRNGSDLTKIDGGSIAANTVTANRMTIGSRGIDINGIGFEGNSASYGSGTSTANWVAWSAGQISYVDDNGTPTTQGIGANATSWSGSVVYLYWTKGGSTVSATTSTATAYGSNNVVLATYNGGGNLFVTYGRTMIDGSSIKAGSVAAYNIAANTITGNEIAGNTITGAKIVGGTITGTHIAGSTITGTNIAGTTITAANLAAGAVTAGKLDANSVTATNIVGGTITGNKILGGAITTCSTRELNYGGANLATSSTYLIDKNHPTEIAGATHSIMVNVNCAFGAGPALGYIIEVYRNGGLLGQRSIAGAGSFGYTLAPTFFDNPPNTFGGNTYSVYAYKSPGSVGDVFVHVVNVIITEYKNG